MEACDFGIGKVIITSRKLDLWFNLVPWIVRLVYMPSPIM